MSGAVARGLARRLGFDLVPLKKAREPVRQLALAMARHGIDGAVDGGAHRGRWVQALRSAGWAGPVLSVEPLGELHPGLRARAARDPAWRVAPPMALGARDGTARLEVSAEPDMSSLRPQSPRLRGLAPSAAVRERRPVPVRRLDGLVGPGLLDPGWARLFVKLDLQGGEAAALEGVGTLWPRVVGLQVEMALLPLYEGEPGWREVVDGLAARGFELHLLVPGYFERKLARQVQVDGVFFGAGGAGPAPAAGTG